MDYYEGRLSLSSDSVLVGSSITVTAYGVDKNDSNTSLDENYLYTFESSCMPTTDNVFSITETVSSSNIVISTYRNLTCTSGDTITVKLFNEDADTSSDTPLATATSSIETALPEIGSGTGAAFNEGDIDGDLELSGEAETDLSATVVNPLASNALVLSTDYIAEWSSTCTTAEFSVQRQTLETGLISTRYTTDLDLCLSSGSPEDAGYASNNTITLIVYERNQTCDFADTSGCTAVLVKEIDVQEGADPKLGVIDDDDNFYAELLVNGVRESEYGDPLPDADSVSDTLKLSAGGTMLIKTNIVDGNNADELITGTSYGVKIESSCVEDGTATLDELEKTTTSGEIRFTYTADGCLQDSFSADLYTVVDGEIATKITDDAITGVIYVHPVEIGAIIFDSVSETYISLKNIGDAVLPKQSIVTFTVLDEIGGPIVGQVVDFELNNTTGGITLGSGEVTDSDVTDSNGQVTVIINSGTSHAVTSVRASTTTDTGNIIATDSQQVTITSGIADQDSFDITVDTLNPAAYDVNGVEVEITAYAADQYQNPVADNTAINFTAESGIIDSSCLTSEGTCTVTWRSSGVRPGNHDTDLGRVNDLDPQTSISLLGMTTITAYTTGEAGFTDQNGNGQFDFFDNGDGVFVQADDETEPFVSLPEVFRDDNWDGALDVDSDNRPVEFFADFNTDGSYTSVLSPAYYQGAVCSEELLDYARNNSVGHCKELVHVRSSVRIIQSTATVPTMTLYTFNNASDEYEEESDITLGASGTFYVLLQDDNENMPADGASLAATGEGFELVDNAGSVSNSIGLLYSGSDIGLPSFGELYQISYTVDGVGEYIDIESSFDGFTQTLRLTP